MNPWDLEPDYEEFEAHGLKCYALRHPEMRNWCGYVAFPEVATTRFKVLGYVNVPDEELYKLDVHGGVTFSGFMSRLPNSPAVLGFDCAHAGDLSPRMLELLPQHRIDDEVYRDLPFVRQQLTSLAEQMANHFKD